jgi:hypothetical protein
MSTDSGENQKESSVSKDEDFGDKVSSVCFIGNLKYACLGNKLVEETRKISKKGEKF